jgi:hypothetical protein
VSFLFVSKLPDLGAGECAFKRMSGAVVAVNTVSISDDLVLTYSIKPKQCGSESGMILDYINANADR